MAALAIAGAQSCMRYEKKANTSTSGTMTMVCDNTFENIMNQEVDVFEYQYPDAHVLVRYASQSEAIDSLMSLNTKTIVIARDLTKDEMKYLKSKRSFVRSSKIAVDAVAFIVNPANDVNKLMLKELSQILSSVKYVLYLTIKAPALPHICVTRFSTEVSLLKMSMMPVLYRVYSRLSRKTRMP